jgi:hypothetical protein
MDTFNKDFNILLALKLCALLCCRITIQNQVRCLSLSALPPHQRRSTCQYLPPRWHLSVFDLSDCSLATLSTHWSCLSSCLSFRPYAPVNQHQRQAQAALPPHQRLLNQSALPPLQRLLNQSALPPLQRLLNQSALPPLQRLLNQSALPHLQRLLNQSALPPLQRLLNQSALPPLQRLLNQSALPPLQRLLNQSTCQHLLVHQITTILLTEE